MSTPAVSPILRAWGHSYLTSAGASAVNKGLLPVAVGMLPGLRLENHAVGGSSLTYPPNGDAWPYVLQGVTRLGQSYVSPGGIVVTMFGLNDINKLGNTAEALAPFKNAMRAVISRWRAGAIFEDSDPTVSYGGSGVWRAISTTTSNSGSTYKYNPTNGGTVTVTTPADFPGGTIAFGFTGRPALAGSAVFTATINGTTYTVDTTNSLPTSSASFVLRVKNLPPGTASYTFTTSSCVGAFGAVFDYWQWEPDDDPPLVVVIKQPKPLDYIPYGSDAPGPPTDEGVDALNTVLDELAAEFGPRVVTVDTSSIDKDETYWVAENVHPNDAGHYAIAELLRDAVLASGVRLPSADGLTTIYAPWYKRKPAAATWTER